MTYETPANDSPRARRRRATTERILQRAMETVVTDGFAALSINRLARELDYTPGALYRYFSSKDVLIATLTARVLQNFGATVATVVDAEPAARPLRRVVAALRAYRDLATGSPHRFGLLSMLLAEPRLLVAEPSAAASAIQAMIEALAPLRAALVLAQSADDLRDGDPAERALVAFSAVHGVLQLRKQAQRAPGLIDLDRLLIEATRSLLVGWGADPAAASDAAAMLGAPPTPNPRSSEESTC